MDAIIDEPISGGFEGDPGPGRKSRRRVITIYLRHLMQRDNPKAAFILPHYTANFYAPNENVLDQTKFKQWLLKFGNDTLETDDYDRITLPVKILANGNLVEEVFGPCLASNDFEAMKKRAILCPFNSDAAKHNENVIAKLSGYYKIYHSFDSVKDHLEDGLHISPEYMNSLNSPLASCVSIFFLDPDSGKGLMF
uniref:ATP-dependent DNA helicase n=1 Tax=Acrobeloides nanus TaxID=290746 RepID=A0A914EHK9_9BILA